LETDDNHLVSGQQLSILSSVDAKIFD